MSPKERATQLAAILIGLVFASIGFVGMDYLLVQYGGPYLSPLPTIAAFANFLLVYKAITGADVQTSVKAFATTLGWWTFVLAWLALAASIVAAVAVLGRGA
jgi:hypothetical protein